LNRRQIIRPIALLMSMLFLMSTVLTACSPDLDKPDNPPISEVDLQTHIDIFSFYNRFELLVRQKESISKTPFGYQSNHAEFTKFYTEFAKKMKSGKIKPDQYDKEIKNFVKKTLVESEKKKKTAIQRINQQAHALQAHIKKLPTASQPLAKESLHQFIALTNAEIKLYELTTKIMDGVDLDKIPYQTSPNIFGRLFGVGKAYASPSQGDRECVVISTEYVSPRLIKITKRCTYLIYIQYTQTRTKVTRLQENFKHTWNKRKQDPLGYTRPINRKDAINKLANSSLQHLVPYSTMINGKPHVMTTLRTRQVRIINAKYAGGRNDKTGVPYDLNGFPVFKSYYTTSLPQSEWLKDRDVHFRYLNKRLADQIRTNPKLQAFFKQRYGNKYEDVLKDLKRGDYPKDLTWHHHQIPGVMQLVDYEIHDPTKHTGGQAIWGMDQFIPKER
jgi:hypothetical protein